MATLVRNVFVLFLLFFIGLSLALIHSTESKLPEQSYSYLIEKAAGGSLEEVTIQGDVVQATDKNGYQFQAKVPTTRNLLTILGAGKTSIVVEDNWLPKAIQILFVATALAFIFFLFLLFKAKQTKPDEEEKFASEKLILPGKGNNKVTFADVAGIPGAKEELVEIIEFLKDPGPFHEVGASIPKGILLQGPPGTGKTLLAKAIAGEAKVPFYSFSGSDFVEMFVGVGASRVRDLFKEARSKEPCIVFIDEIDAVGTRRSDASSSAGGQSERGQTLNALLVEMDGFRSDETIVVLAATNRPDILDPALRRPGRFDRQINILPPDVKGRHKILKVHANKVKLLPDVDLSRVAKATPGFTGAELANLVNEAALLAARNKQKAISAANFDAARDRVMLGVERKGLVLTDHDRKVLSYHEAGHTIVARNLPDTDPVMKISIIPRGRALGQTQQLPENDRHALSYDYLKNRITILMGGRAAEEIIFGQRSTGAQDDILQATEIATNMICKWGMSETLGPQAFSRDGGGFLGSQDVLLSRSDETVEKIDQEVHSLLEQCYQEATTILSYDLSFLKNLAEILLQAETLDSEELDIIFECTLKKEAAIAEELARRGLTTELDAASIKEACSMNMEKAA